MEKASEIIIGVTTALAGLCAYIVKKLWGRIDNLETQMVILERNLIRREDIEQLKDTQNLILQSLLEHRNTEKKDVH